MVNRARQQQAAQQQAPAREHDLVLTAKFKDEMPFRDWLTAAWSPDGSWVAVGGRLEDKKAGGMLGIWNARTGHYEDHSVRHLRHDLDGQVVSVSWSPSGTHLAAVEVNKLSGQATLNIRSEAEGKRGVSLPGGWAISQVAWSPDGRLLALSDPGSRVTLLVDPVSGQLRRTLEGLSGPVAWEPGGRRLAGPDGAGVAIFDAGAGQRERTISGQQHQATAVAWATGGKVLAVSDGEHIQVLDADTGKRRWSLPWATAQGDRSDDSSVHYLGWLDRGRYLLEFRKHGALSRTDSSTVISTVALWDITSRVLFSLMFHVMINRVQRPLAEILVAPQGGRQVLLMHDHRPPDLWEITGDLPGLEP